MKSSQMIIFTDLDGSLLDRENYSYKEAEPALELLKSRGIPLVFCSSKTMAEQVALRKKLGLNYPFIVEDGGATFIGRDYFRTRYLYQRVVDGYNVVEYGMPYQHIRRILKTIVRETGLELKMYGDMSVDEIVDRTGLSLGAAERARGRQYQETIVSPLSAEDFRRLTEALSRRGLRLSAGTRYYGVMGTNDKGRAAADLIELYHQEYGNILTVGIGDGRNDAPLFAAVDRPVLVQKPGAIWEDIDHPKLVRIEGAGPVGWNRVIIQMLS